MVSVSTVITRQELCRAGFDGPWRPVVEGAGRGSGDTGPPFVCGLEAILAGWQGCMYAPQERKVAFSGF